MRGIVNSKYEIKKKVIEQTLQADGAVTLLNENEGDVLSVCVNSPQLYCPLILKSQGFYYATLRQYNSNDLLVSQPVNLTVYYIKK